jgi:hypothetical protein
MLTSCHYEPPVDAESDHEPGSHDGEPRLVLARIRNHHREYAWTT